MAERQPPPKNYAALVPECAAPLSFGAETTSDFGLRQDPFGRGIVFHTGRDFLVMEGEKVRAVLAGEVTHASAAKTGPLKDYGKMVEIDHGGGLKTRYGHLSEIDVGLGQKVKPEETIGRAGNTGRSTGAHLHFETLINGEWVDPRATGFDPRMACIEQAVSLLESHGDTVILKEAPPPATEDRRKPQPDILKQLRGPINP